MIRGTEAMDQTIGPKRRLPRRLVLVLVAAVLLTLAALGPSLGRWWRAERTVDVARVRLGTVERGDLERDVAAQARVVAAAFPRLFSSEAGIAQLHVRAGDDVDAGTLLVTVTSPALEAAVAQQRSVVGAAEGGLARARIAAKRSVLEAQQEVGRLELRRATAERELDRMRQLAAEGLANRVELDRAQDESDLAALELEHATGSQRLVGETNQVEVRDRELAADRERLALGELERRLAHLEIRSPFAGRVANVAIEDRDAVAADQALVTVLDLSRSELELPIPEAYADEVAVGTAALVTWEGREWPAEVVGVSPQVASGQVATRVTFSGQTPSGLRQNQRLSARLILERRQDVLRAPRGPFLEAGAGRRAWVVRDDLAVAVPITTGAVSVSAVEIVAGLEAGDTIVISDTSLFEGAEIVYLRR